MPDSLDHRIPPFAEMTVDLSGMKIGKTLAVVAVSVLLAAVAMACAGSVTPTAAPQPTPTPVPDPAALLAETAENLRSMRSADFLLRHETGAIFFPLLGARLTEASGVWDAAGGAELAVDAYLVPDAQAEADSGIYFQMQAVITPDAYYGTDPLSGAWIKQPRSLVPIPVDELNAIIADLVENIADPTLDGRETTDGHDAYRISGDAPASVMDWLLLTAEEEQSVRVEIWTDTGQKLLRKLRVSGAVGSYDQPDTVRELLLTNINGDVTIQPPAEFLDLSGG